MSLPSLSHIQHETALGTQLTGCKACAQILYPAFGDSRMLCRKIRFAHSRGRERCSTAGDMEYAPGIACRVTSS